MSINYRRYRRRMEKMYEDRCTITGSRKIKKPNGATGREDVVVVTNEPCRISQKALGTNGQTETKNNITYETKLFISPDIEVVQGDVIEASRNGIVRKYTAGEAFLYPTHLEVSIQRSTEA